MEFDEQDAEAAQTEEENTDTANKRKDFVEEPRKYKGKAIFGIDEEDDTEDSTIKGDLDKAAQDKPEGFDESS